MGIFKPLIPAFLRGNLRELIKKLFHNPWLLLKSGIQSRPDALIMITIFILLLILAGILAITQESDDEFVQGETFSDNSLFIDSDDEYMGEPLPDWIPFGPPRWFRSNAGGMTLEEIPSRLAALRNKYALVIDYIPPDELEPRLLPFFHDDYIIEVRVLYSRGRESRRQWLFLDEAGNIFLNAVFRQEPDEPEFDIEDEAFDEEINDQWDDYDNDEAQPAEFLLDAIIDEDNIVEDIPPEDETPAALAVDVLGDTAGFIEIFNKNSRIIRSYTLFKDGGEILTEYFYNQNVLIKTDTRMKAPEAEEYNTIYTDTYRYNRSLSLRNVERFYQGQVDVEPVRLLFPSRILEAAANVDFLSEKLTLSSDFFGSHSAGEGFRMVYDTDSRGRILTQTMFDDNDNVVWAVVNTWSGDRITSILQTDGDENKLTEYEYNSDGDRIVQRDIHNGILERVVYTDGQNETEELFMNGVVVLRAYWENGRKTHEERVRHQ
jgi:hypothetical protein